jgi:hypothetical protein
MVKNRYEFASPLVSKILSWSHSIQLSVVNRSAAKLYFVTLVILQEYSCSFENNTRIQTHVLSLACAYAFLFPSVFPNLKMVIYNCCAINCGNNKSNRPDLKFFRFPSNNPERSVNCVLA